jgi:hypothetical protein
MLLIGDMDEIPFSYAAAIDGAETLAELRRVVRMYGELASDAAEVAASMTPEEMLQWRDILRSERAGTAMAAEDFSRFGALLLPRAILMVSLIAELNCLPWGFVYNRLKDAGGMNGDTSSLDFAELNHLWSSQMAGRARTGDLPIHGSAYHPLPTGKGFGHGLTLRAGHLLN